MVAHDAQNVVAILAATETIGGIGQPVVVQRASEQHVQRNQ